MIIVVFAKVDLIYISDESFAYKLNQRLIKNISLLRIDSEDAEQSHFTLFFVKVFRSRGVGVVENFFRSSKKLWRRSDSNERRFVGFSH